MHAVLRLTCSDFDPAAYAAAVRCALLLERVDDVVSQVHNSFAEAIKEQTKGVLHQHVLLSLDQAVTAEQERSPYLL